MPDKSELIRRLRAVIADAGGYEGEREAAREALDRVMRKYGISESDLASADLRKYEFRAASDAELSLKYCILANYLVEVVGRVSSDDLHAGRCVTFWIRKGRKFFAADLAPAEYAEALARMAFWVGEYRKRADAFLSAFIQGNGLTTPPPSGGRRGITEKEMEILRMAGAMKKSYYASGKLEGGRPAMIGRAK